MNGFERFGMWANLGARLTRRDPGDVVMEAVLTVDAHGFPTSRGAIVHGGAIAALPRVPMKSRGSTLLASPGVPGGADFMEWVVDIALASAGAKVAPDGQVTTTVDRKVDFLQPARPGPILARGRVQRRTRRLCFTAGSAEQADGTVVAEARAPLAYVAR